MSENNPIEEAEAFVDFAAKYEKERKDRKNVFKSQMTGWCKFLLENGILQVVCEYDGSGDSGDIESVYFYSAYGEPLACGDDTSDEVPIEEVNKLELPDGLKQSTWIRQDDGIATWGIPDGEQKVVDAYVSWVSEALPDGFEINDGGFGRLDFHVSEIRLNCEHNARMTHYETETYEI